MMTGANGLDRMLGNVSVSVSVELGRTELPLKQVLSLAPDSVVPLDRLTDELLDVMVNGRPIAKAEVTTQDGRFALRIVELLQDETSSAAPAIPASPGPDDTPKSEAA